MVDSEPDLTATVAYEYVWKIDDTSRQTLTHTTTYVGSPGTYTAYALVVNMALPSPSQIETVGILYTIVPGVASVQHVSATVATHRPTTTVLQTSQALVTSTTTSAWSSALPEMHCHNILSDRLFSFYEPYLTIQIILVCLFCGGYLWFRRLRHPRNQDDELEQGRGTFSIPEKLASDKSAEYAQYKPQG
ncbi:unnamed protein product [Aureobasidium vineae]|uniref:PKD domain-containing protein n=1 Tax=Aureobasidium vineae TaxID=2773715 RepID=A0A9N8P853_9PEZI|nr:unnamed protein product [Aureobasidium vineae]